MAKSQYFLFSTPKIPMSETKIQNLLDAIDRIILGKPLATRLAIACLIARGHLLVEDVPGVGKTTLAHALGQLTGLNFQRIQFTSDLLPADIVGVSIFDQTTGVFRFHRGPLFAQLILADEINRATPKTQSALLEAMEERQITADGQTFTLEAPFFVIGTQNPMHQIGTFPLPESQLDRFLVRISMGYPNPEAEKALLMGEDRRSLLQQTKPIVQPNDILAFQQAAKSVVANARLVAYVQALLVATRSRGEFPTGLSPRAGLGLLAVAKAWALIQGRDFVVPEDVQTVFPHVAVHRLRGATHSEEAIETAVKSLLHSVPV